ncbi:MAG: cbb3-type cytochrome c oxidase subunit I, partial [Aequorivita sp.]|nr:cbb3-type cytochrome c oxidase subunit I [Aequorivita sp.]
MALEKFTYDNQLTKSFAVVTVLWGVVGFLVGLIAAFAILWPAVSMELPFLTFGRLRPLHTNAAIFAFVGNAIFTGVYYSLPRLLKTNLFSKTLGWIHFWGWQLIIVLAAVTLLAGITTGKEYAELEWPIDIAIAVVWVGFFGVNFFMTLATRRERHMYVTLWFYIATIVTVALLHVFNNLVVPIGLFKSYSIYAGVQDAFMQWWYGHNAV